MWVSVFLSKISKYGFLRNVVLKVGKMKFGLLPDPLKCLGIQVLMPHHTVSLSISARRCNAPTCDFLRTQPTQSVLIPHFTCSSQVPTVSRNPNRCKSSAVPLPLPYQMHPMLTTSRSCINRGAVPLIYLKDLEGTCFLSILLESGNRAEIRPRLVITLGLSPEHPILSM